MLQFWVTWSFFTLEEQGREVAQKDVTDPELRNMTDVKITFEFPRARGQPEFNRNLIVLQK